MALRYVFSVFFASCHGVSCHCVFSPPCTPNGHTSRTQLVDAFVKQQSLHISAECPMMSDVKSEEATRLRLSARHFLGPYLHLQGLCSHCSLQLWQRCNFFPKFRRIGSSLKPTYFSHPLPSTLFLPLSSNYRISVSHRMFHGQKMY